MIVVAAFALWQRHSRYALLAGHGLTTLLMVGMVERSYQLLGTERGWFFGSCNMDAGLPGWFALDRWFPAIFEVKEACGYTPLLPLGVSMAEALMAFSVAMVTVAALLLLLEGWRLRQR